jgi:hypothetical protein
MISEMFLKPTNHLLSILSLHINIIVSVLNLTINTGHVKGHLVYFDAMLEV